MEEKNYIGERREEKEMFIYFLSSGSKESKAYGKAAAVPPIGIICEEKDGSNQDSAGQC